MFIEAPFRHFKCHKIPAFCAESLVIAKRKLMEEFLSTFRTLCSARADSQSSGSASFSYILIKLTNQHVFNNSFQVMLERHVNNHFSEPGSSGANHSGPRKSTESGDTARKRLKRAGVKLKFRQLPFSARIFDFFDAGNMAGIRHTVAELEERSCLGGVTGDTIQLSARVLGTRIHPDGQRWLNVRWTPNNQ